MARNDYPGTCYRCNLMVAAGTGHFQRHQGTWRVHHANFPGHGRVTCAQATNAARKTQEAAQLVAKEEK